MPNKDNLRLWVAALRSGEYEQGHEFLYKDGTWCCLGVACDVAIKNGVSLAAEHEERDSPWRGHFGVMRFDGHAEYLPQKVQDWLGIDSADPELGGIYPATQWNDDLGAGFDEIATLIEIEYDLTREAANG